MEERIEINGEWYVKEKPTQTSKDYKIPREHLHGELLEITNYEGFVYEDDFHVFEATMLLNEDDEYWGDVMIEVTDKMNDRELYFDNPSFLIAFLQQGQYQIKEVIREIGEERVGYFWRFIKSLREKGWLPNINN